METQFFLNFLAVALAVGANICLFFFLRGLNQVLETRRIEKKRREHRLDTRFLIRARDQQKCTLCAGTYGTRFDKILVYDENGDPWVGLLCPEVIETLRKGQYEKLGYIIPFRGMGEKIAGKPVYIYGTVVEVYPTFLRSGVNLADWKKWVSIEKHFCEEVTNGWNYQQGLRSLP